MFEMFVGVANSWLVELQEWLIQFQLLLSQEEEEKER